MDFRLGLRSRARILPRDRGLREVVAEAVDRTRGKRINRAMGRVVDRAMDQAIGQAKDQATRAEAVAVRCVEGTRPVWSWLAREWRRLGTAGAVLLITGLLLHAMLGANGIVIYRQKRAEMRALKSEVERLRQENDRHVDQIKSLKSDPAAIEKEAREQLHYTRPGEVILVAPEPAQKSAPAGRAQIGK